MRRLLALAAVLLSLLQFAGAQEIAVSIDGEPFSKKFIGRPPIGDKLVEFVREASLSINGPSSLVFAISSCLELITTLQKPPQFWPR